MKIAIRFYEELNDFLPVAWRKRDLLRRVEPGISVGRLIDQFGVPKAAVDLVLVNGKPAGFSQVLAGGDRLSVYPVFESFDISGLSPLPGRPLRSPRFLVADHLGKLAKYLRMAGFDALCRKGSVEAFVSEARKEDRIILSRSARLMKVPNLTHAYRVRSAQPDRQLSEVIHRFDLTAQMRPLTRCLRCNLLLEPVDRLSAAGHKDSGILDSRRQCRFCPGCRRLYWPGSRASRMIRFMKKMGFHSDR